jgi:hypothetical protein
MPKILLSKSTLIGAALLLSTTALGVTLTAARDRHDHHGQTSASAATENGQGHRRMASEHGMRRHDEGHHRRHAEDDGDDDEEGDEGGRGGPSQPLPSGPGVTAPDNGLFNGKSKPKIDVQ